MSYTHFCTINSILIIIQWNPGITVTLGTDKNGRNLGMAVFVK